MLRHLGRCLFNSTVRAGIMDIHPIPCLSDNYAYLLVDRATKTAAAIDPVEPEKVLAAAAKLGVDVTMILTTHHHTDHAGGNAALTATKPNVPVYGGDERIAALSHRLRNGDQVKLGDSISVLALHTPCHTRGHLSYHAMVLDPKTKDLILGGGAVFTGDTLFLGGCGRFFEGTAAEMSDSLDVLAGLPEDTRVYCGHEYTKSNLKFAMTVDPTNQALTDRLGSLPECTVPGTIGEELATNPFLRIRDPAVQAAMGMQGATPLAVMAEMRERKNNYRG
ncbi:hydroxyacylglutathione hydrolase cytoplasmic [Blastocladiella britannica]|nr:hydroxyacylglutathione hydrolase cytoplasmic [Blastocladiella britannica]